MQRGLSINIKVGIVISMILMVGWIAVAGAENRRKILLVTNGPLPIEDIVEALVYASGCQLVHTLSLINGFAIELPQLDSQEALAKLLQKFAMLGLVLDVYDDPVGMAGTITSVSTQDLSGTEGYGWGPERIGLPMVYKYWPEVQGTGVDIAILDSGVDRYHPELYPHVAGGVNALRDERWNKSYYDTYGHGTHMAGIIAAARNKLGTIGVAPGARLWAVRVLDSNGIGYASDVIKGLEWVDNKKIGLVNMSLGFIDANYPLEKATRLLSEHGVIMVAAAGNKSCPPGQTEGGGSEDEDPTCNASQLTEVKYPARYSWVIAVSAIDVDDHMPSYTLSGPAVDVVAPGGSAATGQILSTNRYGGYAWGSGTSQATAHVTGSVALALQRAPWLSFWQVRSLLRETAWDLGYAAEQQGAGLIDVESLMKALE